MSEVSSTAYESLNPLQQRCVDGYALREVGELETIDDIVGYVQEEHPDTPEGTVTSYGTTLNECIEERADVLLNNHDTVERGNVKIEGEIDLTDENTYPAPQTFDERPYKGSDDEAFECEECGKSFERERQLCGHKSVHSRNQEDESGPDTVTVELPINVVYKIVNGEYVSGEERKDIFREAVNHE